MRGKKYQLLVFFSDLFGNWFFAGAAKVIAAGYFLFSPRTRISRAFYAALFPDRSAWYHHWCTFQQFQNFTTIHVDRRLLSKAPKKISYTSQGLEHLQQISDGSGAVILQSHLGNWDIAAHLLQQEQGHKEMKLLLYMGIRDKEEVEQRQKEELRSSGIRIIGVDQNGGSPFNALEGITHLRAGGVLSLTGDVLWQEDQRSVAVNFLGHTARLPAAPYIFALLSGAPLLIFFTFRTGRNSYHFTLSEPIFIKPTTRAQRDVEIQKAAQQYADLLEQTLRRHPFEWYHFDQFIY